MNLFTAPTIPDEVFSLDSGERDQAVAKYQADYNKYYFSQVGAVVVGGGVLLGILYYTLNRKKK